VDVRIESRIEGPITVVTIAGRLGAGGVRELHKLCRSIEGALALDLSGLASADPDGLDALRELVSEGVELRGVSPFIRLLLNGDPVGDLPSRGP
jgi:hypothetical protein